MEMNNAIDHCDVKLPQRVAILLIVVASGGGLLFGYDIGVVSGALNQLTRRFHLTCPMQELVVSSMLFGALFGSLIGGYFIDKYGRKLSIIFSSILFCVGGVVISASQAFHDVIIGRVILGVAMALAAASECVYVSELAPQAVRGRLVSLNEFGITVGILFSYLMNVAFANDLQNGWRYMFGLSTVIAVVVLLCIIFLPRSPRYLIMKGKNDQAKAALLEVRRNSTVHQKEAALREFDSMLSNVSVVDKSKSSCSHMCSKSLIYPLAIAAGLVVLQQSSGEPNALFYAKTILTALGFHNDASAALGTVGLGVSKVVATIFCLVMVDKLGRRKLLLVGCAIMFLTIFSVSVLTFQFKIEGEQLCKENNTVQYTLNQTSLESAFLSNARKSSAVKWFALMLLILFVAAYSISFGPVTWIVLSEIFPRELRGRLFSVATSLNWAMNLLISSTFLGFAKASGGLGWPFMLSAIFCLFSIAFVYYAVPETKGKSLEEVTAILNKGLHCKSCRYFFIKSDDSALLIADTV